MRTGAGLALLVALSACGEWLASAAGLPVPGSVLGMLALAGLIGVGAIPARWVDGASALLVRHLALFYVPAGVAILVHVAVVRRDLPAIVAAGLASLVAGLIVVGVVAERLGRDR